MFSSASPRIMWDTSSWYAIMWPRLLPATFAQFVSSSVASRLEWQLGSWQKRDRVNWRSRRKLICSASCFVLVRSITPINPALKPDRRGIGKKSSSGSEYFFQFYMPLAFIASAAVTLTVEQASSALQLSSSSSSVAAITGKSKLDRCKRRKERDDELKVHQFLIC
jgi:hypothetical protein